MLGFRAAFRLNATVPGTVALSDHAVRLPPLACSNAADHGNARAVRDLLNTLPMRTASTSLGSADAFQLNAAVPVRLVGDGAIPIAPCASWGCSTRFGFCEQVDQHHAETPPRSNRELVRAAGTYQTLDHRARP